MTTTVTGITLCTCRHIHSVHNADADCGALVAAITATPVYGRGGWRITTNLGDLPPLSGACAAHVLTGAPSW
jgi:hypothetical protein